MAKTKKQEAAIPVTRAEKTSAAKNVIKEILKKKSYKHNDLIDAAAKSYAEKFSGEDTENVNDVKGRVGSVLDIMKKEGEVAFEGGMYALKQENKPAEIVETTVKTAQKAKTVRAKAKKEVSEEVKAETAEKKKTKKTSKKMETLTEKAEVNADEKAETPKKKTIKKTAKKQTLEQAETIEEQPAKKEKEQEEYTPIPPAPLQPIAPVAPITPEVAPEPIPEDKPEEKPTPKKRGRKTAKAEKNEVVQEVISGAVAEEKPEEKIEPKTEVKSEEPKQLIVKEKAEIVKKDVVDMSFLFGGFTQEKKVQPKMEQKAVEVKAKAPVQEEKKDVQPAPKTDKQPDQKLVQKEEQKVEKAAEKAEEKSIQKAADTRKTNVRKLPQNEGKKLLQKAPQKLLSADERLRENFLKRLRQLGGEYFEYYSVYLLERYSMKNGRRLEGMRISGGGHDGGIDGEIELTDRFGFKETIYIQSKNWDPDKGNEKLWVVGETLLQQFIGACVCRQAKDGKQNARGIFVTTSRFTPDAKKILNDMSDKIIGYDGEDVYEAAKECQFGLVYENGNWKLDEKLLSGEKAFFNML